MRGDGRDESALDGRGDHCAASAEAVCCASRRRRDHESIRLERRYRLLVNHTQQFAEVRGYPTTNDHIIENAV